MLKISLVLLKLVILQNHLLVEIMQESLDWLGLLSTKIIKISSTLLIGQVVSLLLILKPVLL